MKTLHIWLVFAIVKKHLVQNGQIDGPGAAPGEALRRLVAHLQVTATQPLDSEFQTLSWSGSGVLEVGSWGLRFRVWVFSGEGDGAEQEDAWTALSLYVQWPLCL